MAMLSCVPYKASTQPNPNQPNPIQKKATQLARPSTVVSSPYSLSSHTRSSLKFEVWAQQSRSALIGQFLTQ